MLGGAGRERDGGDEGRGGALLLKRQAHLGGGAKLVRERELGDAVGGELDQLAREQQREPGEVLEEAVRRYAAACRLEKFAEKMGSRAREKGIREEDVPRLVEEVRRENNERGR